MHDTKSLKSFSVFVITCLLLSTFLNFNILADEPNNNEIEITIAHTNDIHGRVFNDSRNETIGFSKMATYIKQNNFDLLFDAGDLFHGQAFATITKGESVAKIINQLNYTALSPGNHDWNYGSQQLKNLEKIADTPILAGNVVDDNFNRFFDTEFLLKEIKNVKIGIFGVIDPEIYSSTAPGNVNGLKFNPAVTYAKEAVKYLKETEKADIVICLSHCVDYEQLAQNIGIDLLITGHLHQEINKKVNDTLVVQAGQYGNALGEVTLKYNPAEDKLVSSESSLLSFSETKNIEEDSEIKKIIDDINLESKDILSEKVGTTDIFLDGEKFNARSKEINLGRVITDSYIAETGSDISFENGGGIRSSINIGDITKADIINVAPFGNYIITKKLSGKNILEILETSIELGRRNALAFSGVSEDWPKNDGDYLQIGGMKIYYDPALKSMERITKAYVGDKLIDLEKEYVISGNNFIMNSETYPSLALAKTINEYSACDEALINYIAVDGIKKSINNERFILKKLSDISDSDNSSNIDDSTSNVSTDTEEISSSTNSTITSDENPNTGDVSKNYTVVVILINLTGLSILLFRNKFKRRNN